MNVTKTHVTIALILFAVTGTIGFTAGYFSARGNFSSELKSARDDVRDLEISNERLRNANRELGNSVERLEGTVDNLRGTLGDIRETNNELRESIRDATERVEHAEGTLQSIAVGVSGSLRDIEQIIEFVKQLRRDLREYFEGT